MDNAVTEQQAKKRYTKPVLKKVNLRPEEAVLGNCKMGAVSGPVGTCSTAGGCSTQGS